MQPAALHCGQRLGPGEELRFNRSCMEAVGTTLMVLNAAGSKVRDPKPLMELLALRRLNLEKCKIESIRDIEPVLMNCRHLQALDVRGGACGVCTVSSSCLRSTTVVCALNPVCPIALESAPCLVTQPLSLWK
jgi:hypothetical protein